VVDGREQRVVDLRYDEQPIGVLIKQIAEDSSLLVHQEVALAKAELTEKATRYGVAGVTLALASVFGLVTLAAAVTAAIAAVALVLPIWAAGLVVMGFGALIAGLLALVALGRIRRAGSVVPERTVRSVKELKDGLQHRARA
jgi:hypothetical protein